MLAESAALPKPYLYVEELAALTPWTVEAIETMKKRGVLRIGVHYFQPTGSRGRLIFKWTEIVRLIEGDAGIVAESGEAVVKGYNGKAVLDVEKATVEIRKLLDRG